MKFKIILFAVISLLPCLAFAQSQAQTNESLCNSYKRADTELNSAYSQILNIYVKEKEFVQRLKEAQRAWLLYRDAHVLAHFPSKKPGEYGSVQPGCECEILLELTTARTKQLKEWLDGTIEGDVCAGSIKRESDIKKLKGQKIARLQ